MLCGGLGRRGRRPRAPNRGPREIGGPRAGERPRRWRTGRPEVANWSPRGGELVTPRWRDHLTKSLPNPYQILTKSRSADRPAGRAGRPAGREGQKSAKWWKSSILGKFHEI